MIFFRENDDVSTIRLRLRAPLSMTPTAFVENLSKKTSRKEGRKEICHPGLQKEKKDIKMDHQNEESFNKGASLL